MNKGYPMFEENKQNKSINSHHLPVKRIMLISLPKNQLEFFNLKDKFATIHFGQVLLFGLKNVIQKTCFLVYYHIIIMKI